MKTLEQWFEEYAISHQNDTNIRIHYICVPAIFFSIVGLIMSIPNGFLRSLLKLNNPLIENWAFIVLVFILLFYLRLSLKVAIQILLFSAFCVVTNYFMGKYLPLATTSVIIFVVAWLGQFYGHKIEGKKPSFLKDLQFLLIGPAWVMRKLFGK